MVDALRSPFKVIAHRGNSSQAPENTYASFKQAIDLQVDYIECDVQLTKDQVPVIIHEKTTHHILPNSKVININDLNWKDVKELDAGTWLDKKFNDQRILSLEEFLLIPKGHVGSMIEIKADTFHEEGMAKIASDVIRSHPVQKSSPIVIGSLTPKIIIWLQEYLPKSDFIAIVDELKDLEVFLKETRSKYFGLKKELATRELIHSLRNQGKEVWSWTVDDPDAARKLVENGLQGIITNHPKKMQLLQTSMKK